MKKLKVFESNVYGRNLADAVESWEGKEVTVDFGTEKNPKLVKAIFKYATIQGRNNQRLEVHIQMTPEEAQKAGYNENSIVNHDMIVEWKDLVQQNLL